MRLRTAALSVAAMGVVFGDIGTSPLYALRACFSDAAGVSVSASSVLGILSLIFWSLALVISVKYVSIILRADNDGEGGVLALTTRVLNERPMRGTAAIATLGLIGCALFYGDGVITPAVTVLGAIEGLSIATPALGHIVLPLAILALLWLFSIQRRGSGAIGRPVRSGHAVVVRGPRGTRDPQYRAAPGRACGRESGLRVLVFSEHSAVAFAVFGAVFSRSREVRRSTPTWGTLDAGRSRWPGSSWSGPACCSTISARALCCWHRPRRLSIRSTCWRRSGP